MAYEKLNLADGDVLKAEHLAHMEQGIAEPSWNDLTDKPLGVTKTVILEEQDVAFAYSEDEGGYSLTIPCDIELSGGDQLSIVFDGVESFTTVIYMAEGAPLWFGNVGAIGVPGYSDTGEQYAGMYMSGMLQLILLGEGENHRVGIAKAVVEQIPSIYLPGKTVVYYSGDYLYADIDCTVKINKGELPPIENMIVSAISTLHIPLFVNFTNTTYDSILICTGDGAFKYYYTAEYTA